MLRIENGELEAYFDVKGAELRSLKFEGLEYIWHADPNFWGKSSPVLFPIVGSLINDTYIYEGKSYTLPRHGFARDMPFDVIQHEKSHIVFSIKDSEGTRDVFPFSFELRIKYSLVHMTLVCTYEVINRDKNDILFSLGAHPAFGLPMHKDSDFEDYSLRFEKDDHLEIYPLVAKGILALENMTLALDDKSLVLKKSMFYQDALVMKNLKSEKITLLNKGEKIFEFIYEGFSHFGIWSAKDADFICLEPWCGVSDSEGGSQQLIEKEGIVRLSEGETWSKNWQVKFG